MWAARPLSRSLYGCGDCELLPHTIPRDCRSFTGYEWMGVSMHIKEPIQQPRIDGQICVSACSYARQGVDPEKRFIDKQAL